MTESGTWTCNTGVEYTEEKVDGEQGVVTLRAQQTPSVVATGKTRAEASRALRVAMLRRAADEIERGDAP